MLGTGHKVREEMKYIFLNSKKNLPPLALIFFALPFCSMPELRFFSMSPSPQYHPNPFYFKYFTYFMTSPIYYTLTGTSG
jgi:hypothetical protein